MSALAASALAPLHAGSVPRQRCLRPRHRCAAVVAAAFGQPRAADPFGLPPAPRRASPPPSPAAAPIQIQRPQPSHDAWAGEPPPRFPVPEALRMPGAPPCTALPRLASLEEVFPDTGFADAFHSSAAFRAALRAATRRSLFRDPGRGQAAAAQMTAMGSTCVLDWRPATEQGAVCAAMDAALATAGVRLRGAALLTALASLCAVAETEDRAAGSLTDIAHTGRKQVAHSWHQDSGLRVTTALLGFPAHDNFQGAGCFTHLVALSHPLRRTAGSPHGAVIEWEAVCAEAGVPATLPPQYILRPRFARGAELLLYSDEAHLHSAPDFIDREAVWRFM